MSVELATERRVACLPEDHPLAGRDSLGVADVLPEPIIAAPVSPGPWRDYWILTDYRSGPAPVVAEASTLDAEMHLVSRGVGLSITSEAVGRWYGRPGVTFVPILDLVPCSVSLAWWPQDTGLVAELAAVANEVRSRHDAENNLTRLSPPAARRPPESRAAGFCYACQYLRPCFWQAPAWTRQHPLGVLNPVG